MGVIGLRFKKSSDEVIGGVVFPSENPEGKILSVSTYGIGKRSSLNFYRRQNRGGKGIIDLKVNKKTGLLVQTKLVEDNDEVILLTRGGMIIRVPVDEVRKVGRNTQGVKLINLEEGDEIADIAIVPEEEKMLESNEDKTAKAE